MFLWLLKSLFKQPYRVIKADTHGTYSIYRVIDDKHVLEISGFTLIDDAIARIKVLAEREKRMSPLYFDKNGEQI